MATDPMNLGTLMVAVSVLGVLGAIFLTQRIWNRARPPGSRIVGVPVRSRPKGSQDDVNWPQAD